MVCQPIGQLRTRVGGLLNTLFSFAVVLTCSAIQLHAQTPEWQQASGSYQGSVQCVGFALDGTIFTGTEGDGLFRSTNRGFSWAQINTGITNRYIRSLAFPTSGTIFASAYLYSGGVFRSTDNGTSWVLATNGLGDPYVTSLTVGDDTMLIAGTKDSGVFISTDDGIVWHNTGGGLPSQAILSLACYSKSVIYAGTVDSGVYYTTSGGSNWERTKSPAIAIYALTIGAEGSIFAATSSGIISSLDQGTSWQTSLTAPSAIYSLVSKKDSISGLVTLFAGSQNNGVYISVDNGKSWQQSLDGLASTFINDLAIAPSTLTTEADELIAGTLYGVYLSGDTGRTWHAVNTALQNPSVLALAAIENGTILAGTDGGGIMISTDHGESWHSERSNLPDSIITSLTVTRTGDILAGSLREHVPNSTYGCLYRSSDQGATWKQVAQGLVDSGAYGLFQSRAGTLFGFTTDHGLIRSKDDGISWEQSPQASGYSFASDSLGNILAARSDGLYVSENEGDSWQYSHALPGKGQLSVTHLGTLLSGKFRSINHGATWQRDSISLASGSLVFCSPQSSDHHGGQLFSNFLGTDPRVIVSTDDGQTFTLFDGGLTSRFDQSRSVLIKAFAITPDGYLFAGSDEGVYHTTLPVDKLLAVAEHALHLSLPTIANYPNPFAIATSFVYDLAQASHVRIEIYDVTGRIVSHLLEETQVQGKHLVHFEANNLPSGIYFARLTVGGSTTSRSILLTR